MNVVLALMLSLLIPPGFLYLIHKLDFYGTGKFHYNFTAFRSGMIAFLLAALLHQVMVAGGWFTEIQVIRGIAPFSEEILKAVILLYLIQRPDFNYAVDGAIYGMSTGVSFSIIETVFHVTGLPNAAIGLAFYRLGSTNLIHAAASGFIGSVLAAARLKGWPRRALMSLTGFAIAIGLHAGFNFMVTAEAPPLLAMLVGVICIAGMIGIINRSLNVQRRWIAETLDMTDQVTAGEAAVVQRIQNLDEVLAPIAQQFGPDKALQTKALIHLQAEIGIKRKIARETADSSARAAKEAEIAQLRSQMNAIRKAIGPYCMLFVRSVYLARGNKLWDLINARVSEAGKGQGGGGLWSTLERRVKASKAAGHD